MENPAATIQPWPSLGPSRKTLLGFFAKLIVGYGLAIAPWPGLDRAYLAGFQSVGRTLFRNFGDNGRVVFKSGAHSSGPWHCELILSNPNARVAMLRIYETRQAYLATALTAALVLASPIPWTRKWKALVLAMLLIHLFLFLQLWLGLLDGFSEDRMAVIQLSPFWKQAVQLTVTIFLVSPEAIFSVAVFVWVIATFRRDDVRQFGLTGKSPTADAARAAHSR